MGDRCVSWSRTPGMGGSKRKRPVWCGGIARITALPWYRLPCAVAATTLSPHWKT